MIALIPARSASKRIPRKNVKPLGGKPLIDWTIAAARASGVFSWIEVCSDDAEVLMIAEEHGTGAWGRSRSDDDEPDMAWVREWFRTDAEMGSKCMADESFAILRPTSPFRTAETIQRAYQQFKRQEVHSIRAVQPAKEHPGKQWFLENGCLVPVLRNRHHPDLTPWHHPDLTPWHSSPTQTLPPAFVQNASLEMAWTYVVKGFGTISGTKIAPFYTHGYEGFDINEPDDWRRAEQLIEDGLVWFPTCP